MTLTIENVAQALALDGKELRQLLVASHPVQAEDLVGFVYKGTSLGMPGWVDKVAWKTFAKAFYQEPESKAIRGWNIKLRQGLADQRFECLTTRRGEPKTFGHFKVVSAAGSRMPLPCHHGLLLDYGPGGNSRFDPTRLIRDPLLAIESGSSDFLMGWSYLEIFGRVLGTPSFFVLERHGPIDHVPVLPELHN
jgi:hypothetical protein